jgi:hypothetical protein
MAKVLARSVIFVLFLASCKSAGNQTATDASAQIEFKKTACDFGIVSTDFKGTCEFEFQNTSEVPLIINDVKTGCNCTSTEWPQHPVMPGKKEIIKVKYTAGSKGVFVRSVTVYSNAKNSPFMLFIRGEVKAEK